MIGFLKVLQLLVSIAVIGLFWLVYPGAMLIFASATGLIYAAAAVGAMFDHRLSIWIAFAFSSATAVLSALGVYRFVRGGFDFISGNFHGVPEIYLPPYLFLAIATGAALVVALHLSSWRWVLRGREAIFAASPARRPASRRP